MNPGPSSSTTPNNTFGIVTGTLVQQASPQAVGTPLTNPNMQATGNVNNYCQVSNQNLYAGANSSADHIVYPDNILSDGTGFTDMGICSSTFSQAAYSVTGPNDAYLFASAPAASGNSGDMVYATDASGSSNAHRWYVNGFNKAIGAWSMKLTGSGLLQVANGFSNMSKSFLANGAAVTYTVPAGISYLYVTTSAAALAGTLPAAAAAIDGLTVTIVTSASVATATWASTGATFVGAPASFTANTPVRMIYDHASLKWYPN